MTTDTIHLDMDPVPPGPSCPVCGQALSWEGKGRWGCDICQQAVNGMTIEEVRAEVESLARGITAMFSGDHPVGRLVEDGRVTGIIDYEPPDDAPPFFDWPPINEEYRAWQDEASDAQAAHAVKMILEGPPCPVCVRQKRHTANVGVYVSKSPGGTETWSCGHAIGK